MTQLSIPKKLLILQAHAGSGHLSITQAIKQGLAEVDPSVQVSTANILPKQLEDLYAVFQKPKLVEFYHLFYKLTDTPYGSQVSAQINLLFRKEYFRNLINHHQPDAVLSNTQAGIQEIPPILDEFRKETGRSIPFYVFVPDPFTPHRLCFSKKADVTFVPTVRTLQLALRYKLDPQRIVYSGHPVRQEFYGTPTGIDQLHASLGFNPDKITILFGASGDGSDQTLEVITRLCKKAVLPFQAIVVSGRNSLLKQRLAQMNFPDNVQVRVFGYISDAQELATLFHSADLVAAKAGPNALFEAVAARKPFLATHYIKGQESGNRNYLISTGIGLYDSKPKRIAGLIRKIIEEPALLEPIKTNIELERARHADARRIIADHVVEHMRLNGSRTNGPVRTEFAPERVAFQAP
jgi:processive 1,2-diacylglycerol beta-glucosyltransferase